MPTDLTTTQIAEITRKLTPDDFKQLATFTDVGEMLDVLKTHQWTGESEIEALISVAKQNENLSAKISAIKYLRELLYDAMRGAGLIVKATRTLHGEDGDTIKLSADLVHSAVRAGQNRLIQKGEQTNGTDTIPRKSESEESEIESNGDESRRAKNNEDATIPGDHRPPTDEHIALFPGIASIPNQDDSTTGG